MVDVMRATVRLTDPDADGCPVAMIITKFSKDGAPIDVYFRCEGFLGRFVWIHEHVAEAATLGCSLPAFSTSRAKKGESHAGNVFFARETFTHSATKDHAITSLRAITAQPPLLATAEVWTELGVLPHSGHGSASDMAATIGPHAPPDVAMTDVDERELGHWRRMAHMAASDGELQVDEILAEALQATTLTGKGKQVQQAAPPAMSSEEAAMRVRYTSGSNRVGRRLAQIRVHARLVRAVSRAVTAAGGWQSLPGTRADYDVLLDVPEASE